MGLVTVLVRVKWDHSSIFFSLKQNNHTAFIYGLLKLYFSVKISKLICNLWANESFDVEFMNINLFIEL